ncbi:glycosyltransferase family 4 protein [Alicyclobacillus tolerans]|uniref:glycosyltransferase family 4 protein n=1 Tax=Alicyclobacillus tolerans TaxID=90970 RepID=UPI001F17A3F9|nr:glycosyltransferase family 4 protein [Alicyclobacillus tolerans]MCF8567608.1 glycosyltransferase family 4 protein [Alicyclobacillus tolerans]
MRAVSVLTHSFLDAYNGRTDKVFGGGLERYIFDLCQVILQMGLQPVVHQLTGGPDFTLDTDGITVYGHCCTNETYVQVFEQMAHSADGLIIYSSQIWQPIQYRRGSIGICHGISWDHPRFSLSYKERVATSIQNSLEQLDQVVSVDSHFLTFSRAVCSYEDIDKVVLLPNSVDTHRFRPRESSAIHQGTLRVLYPRRISQERGALLMMLAADELVSKYPYVTVEFAGEVIQGDVLSETFLAWQRRHPYRERIVHHVYTMDEMPEAYQRADIAVIPTIFSEGTSYSCLEALSCGLAIVSTNVGGLNDLIIDNFNGRLVTPNHVDLVAAISELIDDEEQRQYLGANARRTALSFDKVRWNLRWKQILDSHIGK